MSKRKASPPTPGGSSAPPDDPGDYLSLTRWLKVLTTLVVASWLLLALCALPRNNASTRDVDAVPDPTATEAPAGSTPISTGEGPWGRLTYVPIIISPPQELVPQATPTVPKPAEWHFPDILSARLPALLTEIGLPKPLCDKLIPLSEANPEVEGMTIRPTREILLALSPEERSALYVFLSGFCENADQQRAFRFCGDSLDEWIGELPVAPETRKLVEPLIYRRGSFLFFADLPSIESSLPSPEQRALLVEALSRESTFLARLELSEESDLDKLVEYWGRGGRANDVRPILQSLLRAGGKQSIDVARLLPPFAASRLYTYHVFSENPARYHRDCHWSSLNFFNDVPEDRFGEVKEVRRTLHEDYYRVFGKYRLGDVVAFLDDRSFFIHSAVYVADDVLFTKNGRGSQSPWMLMRLDDMKHCYPRRKDLEMCFFRRKDL